MAPWFPELKSRLGKRRRSGHHFTDMNESTAVRLIRIIRGLDIPIAGEPEQVVTDARPAGTVALLGRDYPGMRPALKVEVGDRVKLGQTIFTDRRQERIACTAPGCGVVSEIRRGARRALLSVLIRLDGNEEESFPAWPDGDLIDLRRDQVVDTLLTSGLWMALRTRPHGRTPAPDGVPSAIFVTAIDTNPLAARPEVIIGQQPEAFADGLTVLGHLSENPVYLCQAAGADLPPVGSERITVAAFAGPHPSGLVGTHIHFLDPVGPTHIAWHLGYQDVIAIGKLFRNGRLWTERTVALGGPMVRRPRLLRTRLGTDLAALTADELADGAVRIISGSVLSGHAARGAEAYLGRFDNQVSVLAEAGVAGETVSIHGPSPLRPRQRRRFALTAALNGLPRAMVPLGGFERVMPLDILPTQILRALLTGDADMAQALGALELVEEDLALCSFVCPSKQNYGLALRETLDRIERDG